MAPDAARPHPLLEIATAFQRSQTLFTLMELRIPTRLDGRARRLTDLAWEIRVHPLPLDRFVNACVALGLLERRGDRVRNAPVSERFLVRGRPDYLGDVIHHLDRTGVDRWRTLRTELTGWKPAGEKAGERDAPPERSRHVDTGSLHAHHNLNHLMGQSLAAAHDFGAHRRLLDLGGGTGAVSIALCEAYPELTADVVDLPEVVRHARGYIRRAGLSHRIEATSANLIADPLPTGADLALLCNVLSMLTPAEERAVIARAREALAPGGRLVLCGWMLDARRRRPLLGVLFCLNDIAWRTPDVERSAGTYARWLRDAGFDALERRRLTPPWSAIVARRAA